MKPSLKLAIILIFSSSISAQTKGALKFNEFAKYECSTAIAYLYDYSVELSVNPKVRAHIIFYEGKIHTFPSGRHYRDEGKHNRG